MDETACESQKWPHLRELVNDGAAFDISSAHGPLRFASLSLDAQPICMFPCSGMDFTTIMAHLDELAERYLDESSRYLGRHLQQTGGSDFHWDPGRQAVFPQGLYRQGVPFQAPTGWLLEKGLIS